MRATALKRNGEATAVLVVDDERGPRESIQLILTPHFRVYTAEGGVQALEILRRHSIDVVTLDLKMSPVSGAETLAKIREVDPDVEVVIITGYGSFESALDVLRLRAFDYISKPFESERILEVVRKAGKAARQHRAAVDVEQVIPPLSQIVEEVEQWRSSVSSQLPELDRITLERILTRLRGLRAQLHERFRAFTRPGTNARKGAE